MSCIETAILANEDIDKTISDNILRINLYAEENACNQYFKSTVLKFESFNNITFENKMPETSGSGMISEDENYFEITITADKARFTFQPPTPLR